jgi:hypothetical protein
MTYSVYIGREKKNGPITYVGITMQRPKRRFDWHKCNGKDLHFEVVSEHPTHHEAAVEECRLIDLHHPKLNKRGTLLPVSHLTPAELEARKVNPKWCKMCLRRRVNPGHHICRFCETEERKNSK